jgi:hypothetical protein
MITPCLSRNGPPSDAAADRHLGSHPPLCEEEDWHDVGASSLADVSQHVEVLFEILSDATDGSRGHHQSGMGPWEIPHGGRDVMSLPFLRREGGDSVEEPEARTT